MVLPKRKLEHVRRGEHLSKTAVVRNKRSNDAEISSSLANIVFLQELRCGLFYENYVGRIGKRTGHDTYRSPEP